MHFYILKFYRLTEKLSYFVFPFFQVYSAGFLEKFWDGKDTLVVLTCLGYTSSSNMSRIH